MKIRSDSPFASLTAVEQMIVLDVAETGPFEMVVDHMETNFPTLNFSIPALKRFVHRLREESVREDVEESGEAMEELGKAAGAGRARDGVLEAMRRKMFSEALEAKNSALAMSLFRMMKEEQK
jgi:hypothetical protein